MKTFVIVSLILAGLLTIGGVAYAMKTGFCNGPEARADWMVERVSQRLELDDTQRDRLEQLRDRLLSMREQVADARQQGRAAVAELLAAPTLDQDRAQALIKRKTEFVSSNSAELIAAIADFSDSLNDEQRATLLEWLERRGQHGFGHRHWRM